MPALHQVSGPTVFLGCALALLTLAPRLSTDPAWSDEAPLHDWFGLVQRAVLVVAILPMVVVLGWRLRRVR